MLVVGAARSGVAAALLLVRRGARVTLTDRQPAIADRATLEARGRRARARLAPRRRVHGADLIVLSPGVPLELAEVALAREAGVPVIGELELASRWLRGAGGGHHRHQGQVDDDDARRPHARGRGPARAGRRQHRRAAQRAGRRVHRRHRARGRGQQLPARDDRSLPPADCGAPELFARSSRSPPVARPLTRRPSSASSRTRPPTTGRW